MAWRGTLEQYALSRRRRCVLNVPFPKKLSAFRPLQIVATINALIECLQAGLVLRDTGMLVTARGTSHKSIPKFSPSMRFDYTQTGGADYDDKSIQATETTPAYPDRLDVTKMSPGEIFYYEFDIDTRRYVAKVICQPL